MFPIQEQPESHLPQNGGLEMKNAIIVLLPLLLVCLTSCSQKQHVYRGDVEVEVDIEEGLHDEVQVVSVASKKPGELNPVETLVELRNAGHTETRVLCEGTWLARGGSFCGSQRSVVVLPPQQTQQIKTGTGSQRATSFRLVVNRTAMTGAELLATSLENSQQRVAEGYGVSFTETPTLAEIPEWNLQGVANGEAFVARTVMFSPFKSKWKLQIIDKEIDPLKGLGIAKQEHPGLQVITIDLPSEPKQGDFLQKKMSAGDGYFQIKKSPESMETTSWNTDNAWVIRFTSWEKAPWVDGGGTFQQLGTASGRLYVTYKGSEYGSLESSWVSGTFEDAAIVCYGKPD